MLVRRDAAVQPPTAIPRSLAADRPGIVMCFGDSLTEGCKDTKVSYPKVLESLLQGAGHNLLVQNAGVWGDTTEGMLKRLPKVLAEGARCGRLEFVLILGGTNDILLNLGNAGQILSRVRQLHSIAGNAPYMPQVGILTLPPLRAYDKWQNVRMTLNGSLRSAGKQSINSLGLQRQFVVELDTIDPSLSTDGVHFRPEGYSEFATRAFDAMQPALALSRQQAALMRSREG